MPPPLDWRRTHRDLLESFVVVSWHITMSKSDFFRLSRRERMIIIDRVSDMIEATNAPTTEETPG